MQAINNHDIMPAERKETHCKCKLNITALKVLEMKYNSNSPLDLIVVKVWLKEVFLEM